MKRTVGVLVALGLFASTAWAADGAGVYDKKCKGCHSIGGVGGPMAKLGGALDDVGSKRDEAWLKAYTADPKSKKADSKMPKLNLSDEDLNAVVAYMLTLKK
jgi:nitric oxide reductase subunit C